jgi:RHS repeat-associated protein
VENGTLTSYAYDDSSKLTQVKHFHSAFVVAQFDYTLDAVDRRTQKAVTGSVANRVEEYEYDDIDQIAKADYGGRDEVFHYDAAGNRTSVVDSALGTTSYSTNTLNQYTSVGGVSVSHDSKGNLAASGGWAYTYDSKNRLLTAVSGTMGAAFVYDSRNRQVSRTINGATTYFIWDGWDLIEERDGTGAVLQKYVHGSGTDEILAKISGTSAVYYHHDGLGSVIALTREDGSLAESYLYDVFGLASVFDASGASISTSGWDNRFLFTGREWIDEVDLYDYRNRIYSGDTGRFLQTDPIRFVGADVNLYRYASNSPIGLTDVLGLYITYGDAPGYDWDNYRRQYARLCKTAVGRSLINFLENSETEYHINPTFTGGHTRGSTINLRNGSDAGTMAHEFQHAISESTGNPDTIAPVSHSQDKVDFPQSNSEAAEREAVRMQNIINRDLVNPEYRDRFRPQTSYRYTDGQVISVPHPYGR